MTLNSTGRHSGSGTMMSLPDGVDGNYFNLLNTSPDPPLIWQWTTVTSDGALVGDLLATFFQHAHAFFHFFDMYLFLDDMNNHRTTFCTPLLVNSMLACACASTEGYNDGGNILGKNSMASSFYLEARKHWHAQEGQDSVTRVHAGIILAYFLNQAGRDKVGVLFQQEAIRIAMSLGLFSVEPPIYASMPPRGVTAENWNHHRSVTAWMVFNWQA